MRTAIPLAVLATALACSLATAPAHARARVFVASYGSDSNPCTFGSPCRNFQQAVNVVDPGGEVTAIDSAGFGPINITKAVTITSPDGVEAGIVANANADAIDINAGPSDAVVLRGLTINGSGVANNGIVFNSGASLTVTNCVVQNFFFSSTFTGNGILIQPASGTINFTITNTTVVNNANVGIFYPLSGGAPKVTGVIDHVVATGNSNGMAFSTKFVSGGSTNVSISNSIASNGLEGIVANGATLVLSIDNVNISSNSSIGINADSAVQVLLGRSVIQGNFTGVHNGTSPNTFFSYRDNRIDENINNIDSPLNTAVVLQ
jgi:hypothetical protein